MATAGQETGRRGREFSPLAAFALSAALLALRFYRGAEERSAPARIAESEAALPEREAAFRERVASVRSAPVLVPSARTVAPSETGLVGRVAYAISEHRVPAIAAGVAFYSLLALIAAVAGAAALYTLYADPAMIRSHLQSLSAFLPSGVVAVIGDQIMRIAAQEETTRRIAAAVGLLFALWSANRGMKAVFDALDVANEERERRGFFALNFVSLVFTLLGVALTAAAMATIVLWPTLIDQLDLGPRTERLAGALRWPALILVVSLAISILYRFGPSRPRARWQWLSVGSLVVAVVWLALSVLLSLYAENLRMGRFDPIYGAIGAVIAFLAWMWLSNAALLAGAELDSQADVGLAED